MRNSAVSKAVVRNAAAVNDAASVRNHASVEGVHLKGSLTVEAAWIMAVVLLAAACMIRTAGRLHDRTKGAMILHEMTEKYRHEKELSAEDAAGDLQDRGDLWMSFQEFALDIEEKGKWRQGKAEEGDWEHRIQMEVFRPETFLRRITLIEDLGEEDEG